MLWGSITFNPLILLKSLSLVISDKLCTMAVAAIIASGVLIFLILRRNIHSFTTSGVRGIMFEYSINSLMIFSLLSSLPTQESASISVITEIFGVKSIISVRKSIPLSEKTSEK